MRFWLISSYTEKNGLLCWKKSNAQDAKIFTTVDMASCDWSKTLLSPDSTIVDIILIMYQSQQAILKVVSVNFLKKVLLNGCWPLLLNQT